LLKILSLPPDTQASQEKPWLIQADARQQPSHLALIVIHPDSVVRGPVATSYGSYDLYVSKSLNEATESVIQDGVQQALIAARLKASGINQDALQSALHVAQPNAILVVASGQRSSNRVISRLLPFACGLLLFIGVITGAQILMTSTIEEKSSRVVEVLLAAVSPLELMWGKLIGQFGVGLVIVAMYIGLGVVGLAKFSLLRFIDPTLVVDLLAFYCITYLVFGALMLSIGAAANQVADAQSLMAPIIMLLVLPYVLTPFIGQAPNSPFSIAISFIPPVNTFGMLARLASSTPPPQWQVWLTLLAGLCAAAAAVWFAAKIFKIGLLMHGKPPNFATLIRWARMA
jgi:ABC-type Na+ efflux pump permease subunit